MDKRHLLISPGQHQRSRIMLVCMLLLTVTAFISEGKVFLRWGAAGNLSRFVAAIGGKLAYSADLTVNGKSAGISVYGLPESNRSWVNSVRSRSYKQDNQQTTLTGLHLSGASLLFQYQRQITDGTGQGSLPSLPTFPQSKQAFHAHDKNADMSISISSSRAAPEQIRAFYLGSMQADGWHIPAISLATKPEGMSIFIREQEVACIVAERLHDQNETRITLLHKKLRIK